MRERTMRSGGEPARWVELSSLDDRRGVDVEESNWILRARERGRENSFLGLQLSESVKTIGIQQGQARQRRYDDGDSGQEGFSDETLRVPVTS